MKKQKTLESLKLNADLFDSSKIVGAHNSGTVDGETYEVYKQSGHTHIIFDAYINGNRVITGWQHSWPS